MTGLTGLIIAREKLISQLKTVVDNLEEKVPVLIHSDVSKLGIIDQFTSPKKMLEDYESVFNEVFENRPYLIPTFNYDFCKTGRYDLSKDFGKIGALSRYYAKKYPNLRTQTPVFNFTIKNNHDSFKLDAVKNAFGPVSTFAELHKQNGYVIFIGTNADPNTFLHYVEEVNQIGYRYIKRFPGCVINKGDEIDFTVEFRVRPMLDGAVSYDKILEKKYLIKQGIMNEYIFDNINIMLYSTNDYFDYINDILQEDELAVLKPSAREKIRQLYIKFGYPLSYEKLEGYNNP